MHSWLNGASTNDHVMVAKIKLAEISIIIQYVGYMSLLTITWGIFRRLVDATADISEN